VLKTNLLAAAHPSETPSPAGATVTRPVECLPLLHLLQPRGLAWW
jgi:hypothetical protein